MGCCRGMCNVGGALAPVALVKRAAPHLALLQAQLQLLALPTELVNLCRKALHASVTARAGGGRGALAGGESAVKQRG